MVICLEQGADLHMAQLMPLSLASIKFRLVLPFWYRLTRVVLDKWLLNGCVCVCGHCKDSWWVRIMERLALWQRSLYEQRTHYVYDEL